MDAKQTPEQAALNKRRLNDAIEDVVGLLAYTTEGFYEEGLTGTDADGPPHLTRVWGKDLLSATEREYLEGLLDRLMIEVTRLTK